MPPRSKSSRVSSPSSTWLPLTLLVCAIATSIPAADGFFFPKSFFRKNENPPPPPHPPPQQHPRILAQGQQQQYHMFGVGEPLQSSGSDVNPSLRIVNRPPPPRNNNDQVGQETGNGPVPGSAFHVPKELCLACESFPWRPVAGGEKNLVSNSLQQSQQSQHQVQLSQPSGSAPTKTIVINALGEAQGPVPLPPVPPSRRPFAIQFDGSSQPNNQLGYQEPPKAANPQVVVGHQQPQEVTHQFQPQEGRQQFQQTPQERPVSFQIFQAQTPNQQPTLLQPVPEVHPIGLNPPPPPPQIHQQPIQQIFGRPTILQPVNVNSPFGPPPQNGYNQVAQGNNQDVPPPNPLAVGAVISSQQNNQGGPVPEFQKIEQAKLVYQEHFTSAPAPPLSQPAPQNFKLPILPHPGSSSSDIKSPPPPNYPQLNNAQPPLPVPQQQNYGPPPPPPQQQDGGYRSGGPLFLQMRPPAPFQRQPPPLRPATNMKPPGPMIHYGQPIILPNSVGPQRPSGQVRFPPPQAFLQMSPPPPFNQQSNNVIYGAPRPEENFIRPQEERRPSPSGQVFNFQPPVQQQPNNEFVNRPPVLNSNPVPLPIPVPTTIHPSNSIVQEPGNTGRERPGRPEGATFTQETGWEIIPSIQTDLTHLFTPEKGNIQENQGKELPVPVPIPVPQSHPPKSPIFIVTGANQQQQPHQQQQQSTEVEQQIKVQDVTYHEEGRNPIPSGSSPPQSVSSDSTGQKQQQILQIQSNTLAANEPEKQHPQPQQPHYVEEQRLQQAQVQPQVIRPRPFILGVPTGPARPMIIRPHPQQTQYAPLHPSIMTALNHAQQTSLLTHQYLSQTNVGQPVRENTIYVSPVMPTGATVISPQIHQQNPGVATNTLQVAQGGIDPRIPRPAAPTTATSTAPGDQSAVNCQTTHQWLIPITQHQQQQKLLEQNADQQIDEEASNIDDEIAPSQPTEVGDNKPSESDNDDVNDKEDEPLSPKPTPSSSTTTTTAALPSQGIRGSVTVQDNGNKGSYLLTYYQRPVAKAPVIWVQPSRTVSQGVVRLTPQLGQVSPSVASTVVTWSRPRVVVANQFRTEQQPPSPGPTQESRAEETFANEETSGSSNSDEHSSSGQNVFDEQIPYGQKLGAARDNKHNSKTPYDIVSIGGSDDSSAQSLEETDSQDVDNTSNQETDSSYASTGNDAETTGNEATGPSGEYYEEQQQHRFQPETNLQSVQQETKGSSVQDTNADDADDEREDYGLRPQNTFRKPVSTTVIHSPGASSFQSLKLPNFKPHRVIVHDFTQHSANAAATGPSGSEGNLEGSESQQTSSAEAAPPNSWSIAYNNKNKAPKFVEDNDAVGGEVDEEEDTLRHHSSSASEFGQRPQVGLNIQEVIASGPVATADCLTTAHGGHFLPSAAISSSTNSPRSADAKEREIFLPIGSRFPGGRPSIFSAVRRPILPLPPRATQASITTTTMPSSSEREVVFSKRERNFGQPPSGFAASIPVPVYRRPVGLNHNSREVVEESSTHHTDTVTYIQPPSSNGILSAEDIYKNSEVREDGLTRNSNWIGITETSTSAVLGSTSGESETESSDDLVMSTERSSSFSVSVVDKKVSSAGASSLNEDERASAAVESNELLHQVESRKVQPKVNVVQVASVPVVSSEETSQGNNLTSTTAPPSPASTSTKIVKTVRVRQRMRSGSFNGPVRTRFGTSRVRVVHRPANQEYIRHFPEATHEGDRLAKEEEQEVKNALIELKKSTDSQFKSH